MNIHSLVPRWQRCAIDRPKDCPARAAQGIYLYDTPKCTGACSEAVYQKVYKTAAGNAIVAMMGTVPGYFFTIAFVDKIGRIPIQFGGESSRRSAPWPLFLCP